MPSVHAAQGGKPARARHARHHRGDHRVGHLLSAGNSNSAARASDTPATQNSTEKAIWDERYRSILDLESHLDRNGTKIIKLFLHLSKEEQRKRFLDRIDTPRKNWKFSAADVEERKYWRQYMKVYEKCLSATSTHHAPWYIVPADDKLNTRLIVSRILLDTVEALKLSSPKTSAARRRELRALRKQLEEEG